METIQGLLLAARTSGWRMANCPINLNRHLLSPKEREVIQSDPDYQYPYWGYRKKDCVSTRKTYDGKDFVFNTAVASSDDLILDEAV